MANVISVCGAGGKTTYIYEKAQDYLKQNKKVAIITTTRMRNDKELTDLSLLDASDKIDFGKAHTFGVVKDNHITYVEDKNYKKICDIFDIVLIEADGSRCMPVKIPNTDFEPVLKDNTNEIELLYSPFAYNRKIKDVCFRYDEFKNDKFFIDNNINDDTLLNEDIIKKIYEEYYVKHIKKMFSDKIKVVFKETDVYSHNNIKNYKSLSLVLLCAGLSTRFKNQDKLFLDINGKPLYEFMFCKLIDTKNKLKDGLGLTLDINIVLVVNDKNKDIIMNNILSNPNYNDIEFIINTNPSPGLSGSVKLAAEKNKNKDAICYFNCDMPLLEVSDIVNMIKNTLLSDMNNGAMYSDGFKNPAMFYKKYFDEILKIEGDKGPRGLLDKYESDSYRYHIDKETLTDVDTDEIYSIVKQKIE